MDKNRYEEFSNFTNDYRNLLGYARYSEHCNDKDENSYLPNFHSRFYTLSFRLLGDILIYNGTEDGHKFREFIINDSNGNQEVLFNYYVDLRLANNDDKTVFAPIPNQGEFKLVNFTRGMLRGNNFYRDRDGTGPQLDMMDSDKLENFSKVLYLERFLNASKLGTSSTYRVFQAYVDAANVCKSSEILFQQLKETKYYQDSVNYMVTSPKLSPDQKYSCGDEDLELLLN